jgi:CheY-like chemotaxis protein
MQENRILIADDDLEDQEMLIEALTQLDDSISIETLSDGRQVVENLANLTDMELPALIVLDYKMPYMNAAEVLETLAKEARYAAVPKVVWSSSHREEDVLRCLAAGACNYFEKPVTAAGLLDIGRQALEYRRINKLRPAN